MTLGELLSNLLGWLGQFVEWIFGWVPRYRIVRWNQLGVKYVLGREPSQLDPGAHWLVPNLTEINLHPSVPYILVINPISVETKDGISVQIGASINLRITSVLTFDAENWDTDSTIDDAARGALQDIVEESTWAQMHGRSGDGTRLGGVLVRRMGKDLLRYGVEVLEVRTTDLVRLSRVFRLFGDRQQVDAPL